MPYTPTKYINRYKYKLDKKKVGEKIASFRKSMNLSQEEFAARLNISRTHISNIEIGKTLPSLILLYNLSKEFSVSLVDFLEE